RMARDVQNGDQAQAIAGIKENLALPAVLGYVCPAPCEKGCRRSGEDHLSIRLMHRSAAEADLAQETPWRPECAKATGKRVAIVGGGPAGLAAAYYLRQYGHACIIYDANDEPGGQLRYAEMEERPLPQRVLDDEIAFIRSLDVAMTTGRRLGDDLDLEQLRKDNDAVVLALGKVPGEQLQELGLATSKRGVEVDGFTLQTSLEGVFAAGGMIHGLKLAVRAVGDGRVAATAVDQYLRGDELRGLRPRFNSRIGRLQAGELKAYLGHVSTGAPVSSTGGCDGECYTTDESAEEGHRCLACDCRKADSCKLRLYAEEYDAKQEHFAPEQRKRVVIMRDHGNVIFEPGKCIKCGICTRLCEQHQEELGLAFVGRGFDVTLTVPFGNTIADGLKKCAKEVVEACPTAALAFTEHERTSVR
ncbi:MAG: FAD-dependent oxidoreductase, partial [Planctomycetota bacterium]